MKKIIALLILFSFMLPTQAMNALYRFYNTDKNAFSRSVLNILLDKNYSIKKQDPYLAEKKNETAVIILQEEGNNLIYYIETNSDKNTLNKAILKEYKNILKDELLNPNYLQTFSSSAKRVITGEKKTYSFVEENPPQTEYKPLAQNVQKRPETSLQGYVGKVGKGSIIKVYLQDPINTANVKTGDTVIAVLESDWIPEGYKIAPQGSILKGQMTEAYPAKRGMRNAKVTILFDTLTLPNGTVYNLSTKKTDFVVDNEGRFMSATRKVATSALAGALTGLIIGGITALAGRDSSSLWKGAAIGAGISGATSIVSQVAEKGIDVEIPAFTELEIEVDKNIEAIISY